MSTRLTDAHLVQKLQAATNSQDSIQTLSLWLLHHRVHHERIVNTWLKVLKKAKSTQRLTLLYVANDVIQNSKRKNISHFKEDFARVLKDAAPLVRDDQIKGSAGRVFNIWKERNVYDANFISELQEILSNSTVQRRSVRTPSAESHRKSTYDPDVSKSTVPAPAPAPNVVVDFSSETLIEKLQSIAKQEVDSNMKMATLNISKLNATNAEIVQRLKDRSHGQQFSSEFEESTRALEELIRCLTKEVEDRKDLMVLLEKSGIYYDTQHKEAKHVANAYKNFGSRVKSLQKKLPDVMERFPEPSPIPSPCPDAPSPTTSDLEAELDLPEDDGLTGGSPVPEKKTSDDVNNAEDSLQTPINSTGGGEPIPILSTFFNQDKQKMPSWLNAFSKAGAQTSIENTKNNDSSSLDSRLSNLFQNIPNLPSSLKGSLLKTGKSDNSSVSSVSKRGPTNTLLSLEPGHGKEEYSGQNTPVQDEDNLASSGATSFFNRLATPKTSQTQKDILKGLTSIIQSASSKDSSHRHGNKAQVSPWNKREEEEPLDKVSSFLNKIKSSTMSPPPSFHNSPVTTTASNNATVSISESIPTTMHSHVFLPPPSTTADISESLSFIPTLVPSTPTVSSFNEFKEKEFEEYDPGCQNFDLDVDMAMDSDESLDAPNSPGLSDLSDKSPDDDVMQPVHSSRQSTLITLVTDSSLTSDPVAEPVENISSVQENYMPPVPVSQDYCDERWPPEELDMPRDDYSSGDTKPLDSPSFVTSVLDHSMPIDVHSNGRSHNTSGDWQHSKIETVQSYRSMGEQKWANNDWSRFNADQQFPHFDQQRQEDHNVNSNNRNAYQSYPIIKNQYPPQRYGSQNFRNERKPHYAGYQHAPQRPRFQSFASRGRGWRNHPHPY